MTIINIHIEVHAVISLLALLDVALLSLTLRAWTFLEHRRGD